MLEEECSGAAVALSRYLQAIRLAPEHPVLARAYANSLLDAEGSEETIVFIDRHPSLRHDPRLQLLRSQARLRQGALDEVELWLRSQPVLPDMREGEQVLTELWNELQTRRGTNFPPPPEIDFRMR